MLMVIGVGQSLRGDDAVGLEVVRRWQSTYPQTAQRPDVRVHLVELSGLALLDVLEGAQAALLVDAVRSPRHAPGTVLTLREADLQRFGAGAGSAHGIGVAEALALGRALDVALPDHLVVLGLVGETFDVGAGLSASVQCALPDAVERLQEQARWLLSN